MPTGDRVRVAAYVCYEPRTHASQEQIERKKEVFEKRLVATHVSLTLCNPIPLSNVIWFYLVKPLYGRLFFWANLDVSGLFSMM